VLGTVDVHAQSKKTGKNKETKTSGQDNSFAPYRAAESAASRQEIKTSKKARKKYSFSKSFKRSLDQKVVEFHQRMKDNAKQDRKEARLAKKPQYSDPSYFGHKRKPKKRKPGKRKFCKECGITH
jgi:hypothetical protein